jgi:hypothetical protein
LVLAIFGATEGPLALCKLAIFGELRPDLTACCSLAQIVIPIAVGWWFLRRKHDQGQLQLAS